MIKESRGKPRNTNLENRRAMSFTDHNDLAYLVALRKLQKAIREYENAAQNLTPVDLNPRHLEHLESSGRLDLGTDPWSGTGAL